jgi:hypothetical protein
MVRLVRLDLHFSIWACAESQALAKTFLLLIRFWFGFDPVSVRFWFGFGSASVRLRFDF